jgi:hypothetical protein
MRVSAFIFKLFSVSVAAACTFVPLLAQAADTPRTTPPQKKEFTVTAHYRYQERAYTPSVILPRVQEEPVVPPNFAEQELISQFSAIDALDFEWWMKTWDDPSQEKIRERMAADKATEKDWKSVWQPKAGKMRVSLTRWLLTGEYVILVYRILPIEEPSTTKAKQVSQTTVTETATAFHLWNGRWHATLDLESDPVMLHFADTKNVFEQVVRP